MRIEDQVGRLQPKVVAHTTQAVEVRDVRASSFQVSTSNSYSLPYPLGNPRQLPKDPKDMAYYIVASPSGISKCLVRQCEIPKDATISVSILFLFLLSQSCILTPGILPRVNYNIPWKRRKGMLELVTPRMPWEQRIQLLNERREKEGRDDGRQERIGWVMYAA